MCSKHYERWRKHGDPLSTKTDVASGLTCSVDGCDDSVKSKKMCSKHYRRNKLHGDPNHLVRYLKTCTVGGCSKAHRSKGYCGKHYARWLKHGDPNVVLNRQDMDEADRFWERVIESEIPEEDHSLGPCWIIEKAGSNGYSSFRPTGTRMSVSGHKYAYELMVSEVPDDLELDHLCRVRNCVNPYHLDPVTHQVNIQRSHDYRSAHQDEAA